VRAGELVAVVGQTGAGKSSLCAAMLGEMVQRIGGPLVAPRSAAYCAQAAWILNATVRENIVFGEAFDSARYAEVLRCCQLDADLAALPHGDATEIGERGITLSGGQKQRVAIARAAYSARQLCILDDVLSALDPEAPSRCHLALSPTLTLTSTPTQTRWPPRSSRSASSASSRRGAPRSSW